mmetsp:Transcript_9683/g.35935  ORF Transcript_9683/g.35935 Transcript_9683/m.35935 type:complete len:284 (+) Transcript_9683:1680-2531(+)
MRLLVKLFAKLLNFFSVLMQQLIHRYVVLSWRVWLLHFGRRHLIRPFSLMSTLKSSFVLVLCVPHVLLMLNLELLYLLLELRHSESRFIALIQSMLSLLFKVSNLLQMFLNLALMAPFNVPQVLLGLVVEFALLHQLFAIVLVLHLDIFSLFLDISCVRTLSLLQHTEAFLQVFDLFLGIHIHITSLSEFIELLLQSFLTTIQSTDGLNLSVHHLLLGSNFSLCFNILFLESFQHLLLLVQGSAQVASFGFELLGSMLPLISSKIHRLVDLGLKILFLVHLLA